MDDLFLKRKKKKKENGAVKLKQNGRCIDDGWSVENEEQRSSESAQTVTCLEREKS